MYNHWITSFVETFTNVGKGWQSHPKLSDTQTEFHKPLIVQVGVGTGDDTCELTQLVKEKLLMNTILQKMIQKLMKDTKMLSVN